MPTVGSIVVRRQLGRQLRAHREHSGHTLVEVASTGLASVAKMKRIEHGQTPIRPGDVRELCRLYNVDEDTGDTLAEMAKATWREEWWERLDSTAPRWFAMYLSLETMAGRLSIFEPNLVQGLFQTEEYAREVERLTGLETRSGVLDNYVSVRMQRQQHLLARTDNPQVRLVLGEAALLTRLEPEGLMDRQVTHLRELAAHPGIEVRVLPTDRGLHPGVFGAFTVMDFPDPDDPAVAYVETYDAARYPENSHQVARFRARFEIIHGLSLPLEEYLR